jgi:hypothetical protein
MPTEDQSSDRSHQGVPQGGVELSLDELAKGLASGTLSRGKAIRWMGGALLGAALASVPGVAWADDCRRLGRQCRRDSQCCSRNCIRRGDDKVCGCPQGQTRCKDRCVNRDRNENHCGACFNRCADGEKCVEGECQGGGCTGTPLTEGECDCGFVCPADDSAFTCQDDPRCTCLETTEGTGFCGVQNQLICVNFMPCSSTSDCPETYQCVVGLDSPECCGTPVCAPPCSALGGVGQSAASRESG